MGEPSSGDNWQGEYRILRTRGCSIVILAAFVVLTVSAVVLNYALLPGSNAPAFLDPLVRAIEVSEDWFQKEAKWWVDEFVQIALAAAGGTAAYLLAIRRFTGTVELDAGELRLRRIPFDRSVDLSSADVELDDWVVPMLGRRGTRCRIASRDGDVAFGGRGHSPASGSYGESGWDVDLQLDAGSFGAFLEALRERKEVETPEDQNLGPETRARADDRVEFVLSPSPYQNALRSETGNKKTLAIAGGVFGAWVVMILLYWGLSSHLLPLFVAIGEWFRGMLAGGGGTLVLGLAPLINIVIIAVIFAAWYRKNRRRIWLAVGPDSVDFGVVKGRRKYGAHPDEVEVEAGCYEIVSRPSPRTIWIPAVRIAFPDGEVVINASQTVDARSELPWSRDVPTFEDATEYSVSEGDWDRLVSELGLGDGGWETHW